jgi:hypothetical protein
VEPRRLTPVISAPWFLPHIPVEGSEMASFFKRLLVEVSFVAVFVVLLFMLVGTLIQFAFALVHERLKVAMLYGSETVKLSRQVWEDAIASQRTQFPVWNTGLVRNPRNHGKL